MAARENTGFGDVRHRSARSSSAVGNVPRVVGLAAALLLVSCGSDLIVAEQAETQVHTDAQNAPGDDEGIFMCGTARCTNHPTVIAGVTLNGYACCKSAARSACGVVEFDQCLELAQPGRPEPSCQDVTSPQLGVLPGCCAPDGTCGSLESNIGLGCIKIPFLTPLMNCPY